MKVDGAHFDQVLADLDLAARELAAALERDPARWSRGRPGKWTAGQHVEHLAITLAVSADAFEPLAARVRDGTLARVPRRGPLQWLWVTMVVKRGTLPRGGKTPRRFEAGPGPSREHTLERLRREIHRHRTLGDGLSAQQRDRLWIRNPFVSRWHYTLPEMVQVHAVHVRHHARLIAEIP